MSVHMPRWAQAMEARTGAPVRLSSGRAIATPCSTCGRWTLQGYDAPRCAGLATCAPHPLTAALEAACVVLEIPTWRLWGTPGRYQLAPRHEPGVLHVAVLPPAGDHTEQPGGENVVVLAAHRCGRPPLAPDPIPVTRPRREALEEAPF